MILEVAPDTNLGEKRCHLIMLQHSIPFDHDGDFFLKNESGKVLAEAELGIEDEKVVFIPLTEQDHQKFVSAGYKIVSPEDYILQ